VKGIYSVIFFVIVGFVSVFLLMQAYVRLKAWRFRGRFAPKVNGSLGKAMAKYPRLIVYFYSPSCGACRIQESYWPEVEKRFRPIIRVDVRKQMDVARAFGVMGTPTTVIIQKGRITGYFVGIVPPRKILKHLGVSGA